MTTRIVILHAKTCPECSYDDTGNVHNVVLRCEEGCRLLNLVELRAVQAQLRAMQRRRRAS